MKRTFRKDCCTFVTLPSLFLACLTAPVNADAAGFSNFTQGAGPMGVANASVAHPEGISSIYFNPALQLDFEGINMEGGLTLLWPEKSLDSTVTAQTYASESRTYTPAHLATSYRITEAASLALSVNNSFGLGSRFPEDTVFRYITTESELTTWDINPSLAFQIHDRVAMGLGFRAVQADASLTQMVPLQNFGLSDGRQRFQADGIGYGWNVGAKLSLTDSWSMAAAYRSPVTIDFSGDLNFDLPQNGNPLVHALFPTTSADADFELPGQFFVGVAYRPSAKWILEAAARFEQYSSYEQLEVNTRLPVAGHTSRTIPKNWKDVWGYMFGVSYQTDAGCSISGGYVYEDNPVPDETFEPGTSGLDKHTLTLGVAKQWANFIYRVSVAHDFYEDREITNKGSSSVLNGTHSQQNTSLALTFSWHI